MSISGALVVISSISIVGSGPRCGRGAKIAQMSREEGCEPGTHTLEFTSSLAGLADRGRMVRLEFKSSMATALATKHTPARHVH
jgi:hypothetical protein